MDTCCRQQVYVHLVLTCMTVLFPPATADPDRQIKKGAGGLAGHPDPEIRGIQVSASLVFISKGRAWLPWALPWICHYFHCELVHVHVFI